MLQLICPLFSDGANRPIGSSVWGYTAQGREFVAIAQTDGAAFAEVVGKGWWNHVPIYGKKEGTLDYIGRLPAHSVASIWREIKGYKNYAIIGSEAVGYEITPWSMNMCICTDVELVMVSRFSTSTSCLMFDQGGTR